MTEILEAIRNRRSERQFDGRAVAPEHLAALIEAFRGAPSSNNRQPLRLIIATSAAANEVSDAALSAGNKPRIRKPVADIAFRDTFGKALI